MHIRLIHLASWHPTAERMEHATNVKSRKQTVALVLAGLALLAVAWWRLRPSPSLEDTARAMFQHFETANGSAALELLQADEVGALKLTSGRLTALLNAVSPAISNAEPQKIVVENLPEHRMLTATRQYVLPDRRQLTLALLLAQTDEGPKVLSLVHSLYMMEVTSTFEPDGKRTGSTKIAGQLEVLPRITENWGKIGIAGLFFSEPTAGKFLSWSELRDSWSTKLARAREQEGRSQ